MDIFERLLEAEVVRRVEAQKPQLAYGVWLPGKGWLKNDKGNRVFADPRREVAESAQRLYGAGVVMLVDPSLGDLEGIFIEREQERGIRKRLHHLWAILTNSST